MDNMKKYLLLIMFAVAGLSTYAQTATQILNKTASVVGRKGGASANFKISSSKFGSTSGSIAIKGNKFTAHTPQAIVWFDGKTQWSYMKKTQEVNITNPDQAKQMSMNPYTFINIYKTGYRATITSKSGSNYTIRLYAYNQKRTVQEMYITINKKTYIPSQVKMRQGNSWSTINVSNFKAKNQPNSIFTFNAKDCPQAEVIDLR